MRTSCVGDTLIIYRNNALMKTPYADVPHVSRHWTKGLVPVPERDTVQPALANL